MQNLVRTPKRWGEAERRVVDAFVAALRREGWQVATEVNHLDVLAERDGMQLRAEVKSDTKGNTGTDVDTVFGQLLRRMDDHGDPDVRYAVVVPPSCLAKVERVPERVRDLLRIEVVTADPDSGEVIWIAGG